MPPSSVHWEQQQPDSEAHTQHPDLNSSSIQGKQGSGRKRPVQDWGRDPAEVPESRGVSGGSQEKEALSSLHRQHLLFSQPLQDREPQLPA